MLRKLAKYSLLSFCSFCFFTGVLQATASEQGVASTQTSHSTVSLSNGSGFTTRSMITTSQTPPTPVPTDTPSTSVASSTTSQTTLTSPTPLPTNTPIPTVLPTATATPTAEPTTTPTPAPQTNAGGIDAEKLFSMVNAHRQSIGLSSLQKDEKTCSLAASRASEIAREMAVGTLHSGMYGRNLPYWNTENAIAYQSEEADFNWWMSDAIHRQAIESRTHTTSCVACSGIYCVQEFTSYQPK